MSDSFATWTELEAHLATISQRFLERWQSPTGNNCFRFAYPHAGEEWGVFFVHNELPSGTAWVFVGVRVAASSQFDFATLMPEIPRGPVGALSLAHEYVCVSHNLPIRGLRPADLRLVIDELCELAKYCQSRAAAPASAGAAFAHLID